MTRDEIDEIHKFQASLSVNDEWLFWNITALLPMEENRAVKFEDYYRSMQNWKLKRLGEEKPWLT